MLMIHSDAVLGIMFRTVKSSLRKLLYPEIVVAVVPVTVTEMEMEVSRMGMGVSSFRLLTAVHRGIG